MGRTTLGRVLMDSLSEEVLFEMDLKDEMEVAMQKPREEQVHAKGTKA